MLNASSNYSAWFLPSENSPTTLLITINFLLKVNCLGWGPNPVTFVKHFKYPPHLLFPKHFKYSTPGIPHIDIQRKN
uniref:Uncharacterized protein n=1 Tax=Populus trichocarpa TaxID=3694 RepID=A0A2K2AE25_POPTR